MMKSKRLSSENESMLKDVECINKYFLECIILTKLAIDQVLNPGPFPTYHYLQSHQDLAQCLLNDMPYLPPDVS